MTSSRLPRRAVVGAVLATSLIGTGLVAAFAEDAASGGCPTWTDPKGDSSTDQRGVPNTEDAGLDITSASLTTTADSVVAKITTDGLGEANSDAGDEFRMTLTVAGATVQMYVDRANGVFGTATPVGISDGDAGFYNADADTSGAATAVYDLKTKTVTITGKITELAKAAGKPVAGQPATGLTAETFDLFGVPGKGTATPFRYDDAATKATLTIGSDCAGGAAAPAAAPSESAAASPSPSPSPSAAPAPSGAPAAAGLPAAGCNTYTDAKGDGSTGSQEGAPAGAPNDPDLDITGVVHETTDTSVSAYIRVDKLAEAPSPGVGHYWLVDFTAKGKAVEFVSNRLTGPLQSAYDAAALSKDTVRIGGTTDKTIKLTATYDTKNSMIKLAADRAALEKALGGPLAGSDLTKMAAKSGFHIVTGYEDADVAAAKADAAFPVDSNACFAPPVPPLSNAGAVVAQYGDSAAVAAKLVDAAGAPVKGKEVTFALGSAKATATTGDDGVAKASLPVTEKAGKRTLTIAAEGATTTVDFTVAVEKTVLKATGGKGAVTATLTDDDKKPVAGQVVTFTSGSKKVSAKTDAKGVAKAAGLPAGNVKVAYAGAAGMYSAATTSTKA